MTVISPHVSAASSAGCIRVDRFGNSATCDLWTSPRSCSLRRRDDLAGNAFSHDSDFCRVACSQSALRVRDALDSRTRSRGTDGPTRDLRGLGQLEAPRSHGLPSASCPSGCTHNRHRSAFATASNLIRGHRTCHEFAAAVDRDSLPTSLLVTPLGIADAQKRIKAVAASPRPVEL
jgi:hypothetical protein